MYTEWFLSSHGTLGFSVVHIATAAVLLLCVPLIYVIRSSNAYATRRELKHLRRIYRRHISNMVDQFDPKFGVAEGAKAEGPIRIKSIFIHPVKSCGPIEMDRALLTKSGFKYDRCFALAIEDLRPERHASTPWRFISQRTLPKMSQVKTELWLPHKGSDPRDTLVQTGGCVVMTFPNPDTPSWADRLATFFHTCDWRATPQISYIAPIMPTPAQIDQFNLRPIIFDIQSRDQKGLDMCGLPAIAEMLPKLKRYLGVQKNQNLTLILCTPDTLMRTTDNLAPLKNIGTPAMHGYTDEQPININSLASVHAVSAKLPPENQPLDALRFRANIWVTGIPAFDEENWKRYRIHQKGGSPARPRANVTPTLSVVCRTPRCTIPNVNLVTGKFDAENAPPGKKRGKPQPSTTMVKYRTVEVGHGGALGYIGMHCVPEDRDLKAAEDQGTGIFIEVGDEIEVLERGEHHYGLTTNDY